MSWSGAAAAAEHHVQQAVQPLLAYPNSTNRPNPKTGTKRNIQPPAPLLQSHSTRKHTCTCLKRVGAKSWVFLTAPPLGRGSSLVILPVLCDHIWVSTKIPEKLKYFHFSTASHPMGARQLRQLDTSDWLLISGCFRNSDFYLEAFFPANP